MASAGRQDGDVAGLQREDPTLVAAETDRPLPRAMPSTSWILEW